MEGKEKKSWNGVKISHGKGKRWRDGVGRERLRRSKGKKERGNGVETEHEKRKDGKKTEERD